MLRYAVEGKASDIHIEPLENETRIRFRLDGAFTLINNSSKKYTQRDY